MPAKVHGMHGKTAANQIQGRARMAAAVLEQAVNEDHHSPRPAGGHPQPLEQAQAVVSGEELFSRCHTLTYGHRVELLQGRSKLNHENPEFGPGQVERLVWLPFLLRILA